MVQTSRPSGSVVTGSIQLRPAAFAREIGTGRNKPKIKRDTLEDQNLFDSPRESMNGQALWSCLLSGNYRLTADSIFSPRFYGFRSLVIDWFGGRASRMFDREYFRVCPLVDLCMNRWFCDPFLGKLEVWSVWSAKNFPVIWTFGMAWTTELAVQLRACCRVLMRDIIFCLLSSYVNLAGRISLLARSWCFLAYFFGWKANCFGYDHMM